MPHLHTGARAGVGWDRVPTASVQRIEDEADAMDKGMNPNGDAGEPTTGVVGSSRSKKPSKGACTAQCSCTWCCCSWQRSVEPWRSSCGRGARTYRAPGCTIPPRAAPSASSHAFPRRQPYPIGYTRAVSLSLSTPRGVQPLAPADKKSPRVPRAGACLRHPPFSTQKADQPPAQYADGRAARPRQ